MVSNRVLVPVRFVFQDIGFNIEWDKIARIATLEQEDYVIIITIGNTDFTVNGTVHELDVPAEIIGDSVMVPMGPVLRAVGYELGWCGGTRTVVIEAPVSERVLSVTHGIEIFDYISAIERLDEIRALADNGDAISQYILGWAYQMGLGVDGDSYKAMELYRMAASQGLVRAIGRMGTNYLWVLAQKKIMSWATICL